MDNISELPDDLLLHILSLLPTEDIVSTILLSKRWQNLWQMVPKLRYSDINCIDGGATYRRFIHFVDKSLLLSKAPVLLSLKLTLGPYSCSDQIGLWIRLAVDRHVRNLSITHHLHRGDIRLPESLCISKSLVVLKLKYAVLEDISPSACFQSLKTLHLKFIAYSGDESPRNILSSCPSLQDLVLKRHSVDNVKRFEVKVRYLQSLKIYMSNSDDESESEEEEEEPDEYVIDTPYLKNLKIEDSSTDLCSFQEMTQLEEANLQANFTCSNNFFKSLRYSKKLSLCLWKSKVLYLKDVIFSRITTLQLCTCHHESSLQLLMGLLQASPELQVLKLQMNCEKTDCLFSWNQPSYVPECLSKKLEIFEYRDYEGTRNERNVVSYILKNGYSLKKAIIFPASKSSQEILQRIKEHLQSLFIGSSSCDIRIRSTKKMVQRRLYYFSY